MINSSVTNQLLQNLGIMVQSNIGKVSMKKLETKAIKLKVKSRATICYQIYYINATICYQKVINPTICYQVVINVLPFATKSMINSSITYQLLQNHKIAVQSNVSKVSG